MQLIRWWGSWIHLHNLNWIVGLEQAERERERERWAVVVAQLAEQLFLTPEVPGSNPVIGNLYVKTLHTVICWKDVSKEKKKPRLTHFWAKKRPLKGKSRMWERKDMAEIESDTYLGNKMMTKMFWTKEENMKRFDAWGNRAKSLSTWGVYIGT